MTFSLVKSTSNLAAIQLSKKKSLLPSVFSSWVCLHNFQPLCSKGSCSSYFSQASLLAIFARTHCTCWKVVCKVQMLLIVHTWCIYHCLKLEVDLTQENVISVALWVHLDPGSGPPPFAMIYRITSLVQSRILAKHQWRIWKFKKGGSASGAQSASENLGCHAHFGHAGESELNISKQLLGLVKCLEISKELIRECVTLPGCCCCMPLLHNNFISCSYVRKNTLLAATLTPPKSATEHELGCI